MEKTSESRQHSASLEHDNARQPRLAIKADVKPDKKTRKRMEGAAAAEQVVSGDNSSAQVDTAPFRLTRFGNDSARSPALNSSRDDALVDNGAAPTKPCFSPAEMRTGTAAGGLLSAGTVSTAIRTIFSRAFPSWTLGDEVNERTSRTNKN